MTKNKKFHIVRITNRGNIDFRQDPHQLLFGTKELWDIASDKLYKLRDIVQKYIYDNELGSGNFVPPVVFYNNEPIGYFSYNCRFWRKKYE